MITYYIYGHLHFHSNRQQSCYSGRGPEIRIRVFNTIPNAAVFRFFRTKITACDKYLHDCCSLRGRHKHEVMSEIRSRGRELILRRLSDGGCGSLPLT